MYKKNKIGGTFGKIYVVGLALVCGLLLLSVDDCEGMSASEQEQYALAMAERAKNDKTLAARMEQERAMQRAMREKSDAEMAERVKAEEERYAAANRSRQQASQNQATATTAARPAAAQSASGGTAAGVSQPARAQASGSQSGRAQTTGGGTTTAAAAATGTGAANGTSGARPAQTTAASQGAAQGGAASGTSGARPAQTVAASQGAAQSGAAQTGSPGADYVSSIAGKNWKLTELRFSDKTVVLNRGELSGTEADIFTLTVDGERVSGTGAPNRYFTAYQAGANNALTIRPIASTMMAGIFTNPQRIREPDYFQYLAKVKSWKLNQNRLELSSLDRANKELVMVFSN